MRSQEPEARGGESSSDCRKKREHSVRDAPGGGVLAEEKNPEKNENQRDEKGGVARTSFSF